MDKALGQMISMNSYYLIFMTVSPAAITPLSQRKKGLQGRVGLATAPK